MRRIQQISFLWCIFGYLLPLQAQVVKDYNPAIQKTSHIQFFKPTEEHLFSGDCMPYYHKGTFYLYWLLDEGHHAGLGGLGGHQWALSTTADLVNWQHYPVALGIDEEWEKSICTGSVIAHKGKFYAFYSTRVKDEDGKVHEQLSYAISKDNGKSYKKQKPNPFYLAPPECAGHDFRDPKVFRDNQGIFHLFISGYKKKPELSGYGGYLVHLVSKDMKKWEEVESPLQGQQGTPECADYFKWNDWYYLLYSVHGYTWYVKSKHPYGPWEYPASQPLAEYWGVVYKTAPFHDRRVAVAYTPERKDNKDRGERIWGGNVLFRELAQEQDGTLNLRFLPEVLPPPVATRNIPDICLNALGNTVLEEINNLPENCRIRFEVQPEGAYEETGVCLWAHDKDNKGYKLDFNASRGRVLSEDTAIEGVHCLSQPFTVDILLKGQFMDVCVNNKRCILNRFPEHSGKNALFYVKNGKAAFRNITVEEITE
ncbi:MAG: family 43 glycosylhydrolase [Tannerellaceae bacterium]|nr:family 43 glycosylhydrolase [Tannerellaceae bacterium]